MRAILTYHSLDESGSPISLPPAVFRSHVQWLAGSAVQVTSLATLLTTDEHVDAVAITFDDAFANFASEALPVLADYGMSATLFVPTGHVGRTNAWGGHSQAGIPTLPLLDWDDLERVSAAGIQLGAHTATHPHLTRCSDLQLSDEMDQARVTLRERTGQDPTDLAYPYGDQDARVRAVAAHHYGTACTTRFAGLGERPQPLALPRLDAFYFRDSRRLQGFGTSGFRSWVRWRDRLRSLKAAIQARA